MKYQSDALQVLRLEAVHHLVAKDLLDYFARRTESIDDAAEMLADTLLIAWRRIDRLPQDDEQARMWMFVTARHVRSNWNRSRRRHDNLAVALRDKLHLTEEGTAAEPAFVSEVRSAMARLPRTQYELVTLVHWDGFSIVDAAVILGIRESTARGRYQRATIRLRNSLEPLRRVTAPSTSGTTKGAS